MVSLVQEWWRHAYRHRPLADQATDLQHAIACLAGFTPALDFDRQKSETTRRQQRPDLQLIGAAAGTTVAVRQLPRSRCVRGAGSACMSN
ncbi:MAG: hypothetical protein U1E76_17250 [Planctomycetota bacterium]